jgi:hypothetical protein
MNTSEMTPEGNKVIKTQMPQNPKPETRNAKLETENMEPENGLQIIRVNPTESD